MEEALTFGGWLKQQRKRLHLTQKELAHAIGYAEVTLRKVEADDLRPSFALVQSLATLLNLSAEQRAQLLHFALGDPLPAAVQLPGGPGSPALSPAMIPALGAAAAGQPFYVSALPVAATPLIEREADLAHLGALLASPACRLITVSGPGGIGKTRLALEAARRHAPAFRNGVVFVDLAGVTDPAWLPQALLGALEVPVQRRQSPALQLRAYLQHLELLVLLDNYEQLLADVELLTDLVRYAPTVTWLVTSRERLALQAEHLVELDGLSYPNRDPLAAPAGPAAEPSYYGAVQLFVARVHQTHRHLQLTPEDMAAIARICRVAEGMPLALELAASAVRVQSCAAIAADLEAGRHRLTAHVRDLPERHLSVDSAFAHSWRLLLPEERRVLRALAVFQGGFDAAAAQAVAGATAGVLEALLDKSLITHQRPPSGAYRYGMHELIRQYAEEKLAEAGERAAVQHMHATYFALVAEQTEPKLRTGEQQQVLKQLDREQDNLHAALERALAQAWTELAARLAGSLSRYWFIRVQVEAGRAFLDQVCALPALADPAVATSSLAAPAAKVLLGAGWLTFLQAEYPLASRHFDRCLAIAQQVEDWRTAASALRGLALQALNQGDRARAHDLAQASLDLARTAADAWLAGSALNVLGELARGDRQYAQAAALLAESMQLLEMTGDISRLAVVMGNAGVVALALGDAERARELHRAVIASAGAAGYVRAVTVGLDGLAAVLVQSAAGERVLVATHLLAASAAIRSRAQLAQEPIDRANFDRYVAAAQASLAGEAFAQAWAEGEALSLEQAVAYALAEG